MVVIKEVVLVPGVGSGVLRLETVLGKQIFARVERLLDLLQPGLQSVMNVGEERNSKIFVTKARNLKGSVYFIVWSISSSAPSV